MLQRFALLLTMAIPLLVPIGLILALVISYFLFPRSKLLAIAFVLLCLATSLFSVYGFLASNELKGDPVGLKFKIIYCILFTGAIIGVISGIRRITR